MSSYAFLMSLNLEKKEARAHCLIHNFSRTPTGKGNPYGIDTDLFIFLMPAAED